MKNFKSIHNRKAGINYGVSPKANLTIQERRKKIVAMIQDDPSVSQAAIGEALGVDRSTVSRDLKRLSEELKIQNQEGWALHRERVLHEIETKKQLCNDRLKSLAKNPTQGSRWVEEWRKLADMEAKIMGLYAPDRVLIQDEQSFDKTQADAAVDAAMAEAGFGVDVIDITPLEPKQIEHNPNA